MAPSHTPARIFGALILLAIMVAGFISLGNWQLGRAAQREATLHAIHEGRNSAPLHLAENTPDDEFVNWRPATVNGTWLNELTVLLDNRNFKGRPGFWVATPLLLDAGTNTAVLVLRGWIPRPILPGESLAAIPAPTEPQTVRGELLSRVPRIFELWSFSRQDANVLPARLPANGAALPQVANLDLNTYARATGLKLLPTVLEQTADDSLQAGTLIRDWPQPSIDASQNKGYALQWFGFASIAGIAWLVIAWRALRRRRQRKKGA